MKEFIGLFPVSLVFLGCWLLKYRPALSSYTFLKCKNSKNGKNSCQDKLIQIFIWIFIFGFINGIVYFSLQFYYN